MTIHDSRERGIQFMILVRGDMTIHDLGERVSWVSSEFGKAWYLLLKCLRGGKHPQPPTTNKNIV